MSVTATETPTRTTMSVLADYELLHSEQQQQSPNDFVSPSVQQPVDWPTNHSRVPAYRPINRNLDQSERPGGGNAMEQIFIATMLHGVWINAVTSRVWRKTFGRFNDHVFRNEVGGEW
ncbi:hypothetical protein BDV25DRAFT_147701 [Aspergillus avenaceus]|uniref:Uncharacterized protein n=1 Tax=Aspergillus avenaceus TaxID=36643 RepID=A0A5N6U715_ASPAV|nr:hypothetical protein BDV25DRAFT_147701 [Aspergillus avenaceus]